MLLASKFLEIYLHLTRNLSELLTVYLRRISRNIPLISRIPSELIILTKRYPQGAHYLYHKIKLLKQKQRKPFYLPHENALGNKPIKVKYENYLIPYS